MQRNDPTLVNSGTLYWERVTLENGDVVTLEVSPGHAFIDEQGFVRRFDVQFPNGSWGHYELYPRHVAIHNFLQVIGKNLAPYGLAILAGRIIKNNSTSRYGQDVNSVTQTMVGAEMMAPMINYSLDYIDKKDAVYRDMATGEIMIKHPLKIELSERARMLFRHGQTY